MVVVNLIRELNHNSVWEYNNCTRQWTKPCRTYCAFVNHFSLPLQAAPKYTPSPRISRLIRGYTRVSTSIPSMFWTLYCTSSHINLLFYRHDFSSCPLLPLSLWPSRCYQILLWLYATCSLVREEHKMTWEWRSKNVMAVLSYVVPYYLPWLIPLQSLCISYKKRA